MKVLKTSAAILLATLVAHAPASAQDLSIYRSAQAPQQVPLSADKARPTQQALQATLYELIGLQQNIQQLHWNVTGPTFYSTHEMLGDFYKTVAGYVDTVAERNRALGVAVDGRPSAVAANAHLPELPFAETKDAEGLKMLTVAFKPENDRIYARIKATEETDPVTSNMLQEVAHDIDKQLWMLRAHQL